MLNLRSKILASAAILVTACQLVTLLMLLVTTKADVLQRATESLENNAVMLNSIAATQNGQAQATITALASDFAFKRAVATSDIPTISSALENQNERAGAAVSIVFDRDNKLLAAAFQDSYAIDNIEDLLPWNGEHNTDNTLLQLGRHSFFTIRVPINAPLPVAWLVMGYAIDDGYVAHAKDLTGMDVSVVHPDSTNSLVSASSLPPANRTALTGQLADSQTAPQPGEVTTLELDTEEHLAIMLPFVSKQTSAYFVVSQPMAQVMAPYSLIHQAAVALASIPLIIALVCAALLSRALTKPLAQLTNAARQIQVGNYSQSVKIDTADELREFADAFNAMQKEISAREKRIIYQAEHDSLTGLFNREHAVELLGSLISDSARNQQSLAVMVVSLNARQELSGSLGHGVADAYLEKAARRLQAIIDRQYFIARLEGDSFIIFLPGASASEAKGAAHNIVAGLISGIDLPDIKISVRPRIGIAAYPDHGSTRERLILRATIAKNGANQQQRPVSVYHEGDEEHQARNMALLQDLGSAIKQNALQLHYQPKIYVPDESVCGVEALVRWDHPKFGWLPPNEFIPVIEQSGNISQLSHWALKTAARQYQQWREQGLDLSIAVNLSAHDLRDSNLPWLIADLLRDERMVPEKLVLELTEQAMVQDFANATAILNRLRDLGVRISVDDFGTGYSSLGHLKQLPVDELKIDRTFISMLPEDRVDAAIVSTTIELAHKLKLETVAEGVSNGAVHRWLQANGIDKAQGYYWSKPLPGDQIAEWVSGFSGGSTVAVRALELA
jgi:diguanylate cyclase (GGDEF)-like protein